MITNVYDKGARDGLHGDPFSLKLDLKPLHIILEEDGEEAIVGVGRHSECEIGLRTGRIAI